VAQVHRQPFHCPPQDLAPNNRSKRARGKLRARYWSWRGPGKKPYAEAIKFGRVGW
jgi:hypothetical protein